jgi:hypothetical protein
MSGIRFSNFPRTQSAPSFLPEIIQAFRKHEASISTLELTKGLTSDAALAIIRGSLRELGFEVEGGKHASAKIRRPVFFGENGKADLQYEIDAYHRGWRCGLEIEAGRGWMGNAVYRDIVQALVMVDLDHLVLAVSNAYRYQSGGRDTVSRDYENTVAVADALFGHSRVRMPFGLTVIGY